MLNRCSRAWWTLLLALTVVVPVAAQNTVGEISGYVRDTGRGALPGVDVRILFPDIRVERSTQTNSAGFFLLPGLPTGRANRSRITFYISTTPQARATMTSSKLRMPLTGF